MTAALAYVDDDSISTYAEKCESRKVMPAFIWPGASGATLGRETPSTSQAGRLSSFYPLLRYDLAALAQVGVVGFELQRIRVSDFIVSSSYSSLIAHFEVLAAGKDLLPDLSWPSAGVLVSRIAQVPEGPEPAWPEPCEAMFQYQAENDPAALISTLKERTLRDSQLSFAAEAAGNLVNSAQAVPVLIDLLDKHRSAVVREGAIYGLAPHLQHSSAAGEALRRVAEKDGSLAVRSVARDVLASFE
jgi:hypothetical protein